MSNVNNNKRIRIMAMLVIIATATTLTVSIITAIDFHWFTILSGNSGAVVGVANISNNIYMINSSSNSFFIANLTSDGQVKFVYRILGYAAYDIGYSSDESTIYVATSDGILNATLKNLEDKESTLVSIGHSSNYYPVKALSVTASNYVVAALEPGNASALIAIMDWNGPTLDSYLYSVQMLDPGYRLVITDIDAFEGGNANQKWLLIVIAGIYTIQQNEEAKVRGIIGITNISVGSLNAEMKLLNTKDLYSSEYPVGVSISPDGKYVYAVFTEQDCFSSLIYKYDAQALLSGSSNYGSGVMLKVKLGGTSYTTLLVSVKEAGNGRIYAAGTLINASGNSAENDIVAVELDDSLNPLRAWIIGGNDNDSMSYTGAMDVKTYIYIGGTSESFRANPTDLSNSLVMLFSPSIENNSVFEWSAEPAHTDPASGPVAYLTENFNYSSVHVFTPNDAEVYQRGISIKPSRVKVERKYWNFYEAIYNKAPQPVPEPWIIMLAVVGVAAISYMWLLRTKRSS